MKKVNSYDVFHPLFFNFRLCFDPRIFFFRFFYFTLDLTVRHLNQSWHDLEILRILNLLNGAKNNEFQISFIIFLIFFLLSRCQDLSSKTFDNVVFCDVYKQVYFFPSSLSH